MADLDGEVITVTLDTGERVYCGVADAAGQPADRAAARGAGQHSGRLLARPITELLRNAEDAAVARAMLASADPSASTPASAAAPGEPVCLAAMVGGSSGRWLLRVRSRG